MTPEIALLIAAARKRLHEAINRAVGQHKRKVSRDFAYFRMQMEWRWGEEDIRHRGASVSYWGGGGFSMGGARLVLK